MSTLSYFKQMIDMLNEQVTKLQSQLQSYKWARAATIVEACEVPSATTHKLLSFFPFSCGSLLCIDNAYYEVKIVNRVTGEWTMARYQP